LEQREDRGDRVAVEHAARRGDRPIDTDHRGERRARAGDVAVGAERWGGGGCPPEVAEHWPVGAHHDGLRAERAVRDVSGAQAQDGTQHGIGRLVADVLWRAPGEPLAVGQPGHEGRVAAGSASPGGDDLGHEHADVPCEQCQVGLVLDLL
jgi:hypothetical protein